MSFLENFLKFNSDQESLKSISLIEEKLKNYSEEKAHYVALYAFILGRVAYADFDVSNEEKTSMKKIMIENSGVSTKEAEDIVSITEQQNILSGSTDHYIVTREFKKIATKKEKEELIQCLYQVSASDQSISSREEGEIRVIASELGISLESLVLIRSKFSQFRDALK